MQPKNYTTAQELLDYLLVLQQDKDLTKLILVTHYFQFLLHYFYCYEY